MKSAVIKRSIVIAGHRTSVSLEDAFWQGLRQIARVQGISLSVLVGRIDVNRENDNLSSALRLFVFEHFRRLGHLDGPGAELNVAAAVAPKTRPLQTA